MLSNEIKKINSDKTQIPLIIRANEKGWTPGFESWETTVNDDTSFILCDQTFGKVTNNYSRKNIDDNIGYTYADTLVIKWKTLVDSEDVELLHKIYNGKLRACTWQKRYCTYYTTGNKPWLHAALFEEILKEYVVHHINAVSSDNRRKNLHLLHKLEHDSINHPLLEERKIIFNDPKKHWEMKKEEAIKLFINEISLIINNDTKNEFIANFAKENLILTKEILEKARYDINLSGINSTPSLNRRLNSHLQTEYLDVYETTKYLKKTNPTSNEIQLKMF